tara:strand:+ start:6898 stop:7791 length:894 start_codon:yes stop_codon:yes gene_type:complete
MINIWCYWSQGIDNIPIFPKKCLENWKRFLTHNYKINIIDEKSFLKMQTDIDLDFLVSLTNQQQSDIVRLYLLYNYGGIWIDITSLLTDDLSWVIDKFKEGYEQVGFSVYYPFHKRDINLQENWFIAIKNSYNYMIKCWYDIFIKILRESKHNGGIKNSPIWKQTNKESIPYFMREYLSMHVAQLWCIQNNNKYKKLYDNKVYLYSGNVTASINPYLNIKSIIYGIGYNTNFPLIKFTKVDRNLLKYLCSNRLKHIIQDNFGSSYQIKTLFIYDIILYIIISIIIIFFIKLNINSIT